MQIKSKTIILRYLPTSANVYGSLQCNLRKVNVISSIGYVGMFSSESY